MFIDFREAPDNQVYQADVCIVGAGAAGITLATELTAAGRTVCLVESGGLQFDGATQRLHEVVNLGISRLPTIATRLRFFGGTTNHWTGKCGRLDDIDFATRDWVPDSGWPITRSELDPYYDRAQSTLDLAPSSSGIQVAEEFNVPKPALNPAIAELYAWQLSPPTRFGQKFRASLEASRLATVLLYANAINIQSTAAADHVQHVDVRSLTGKTGKVKAANYVLSSGGIENARLLLLSNTVESHGLGNQHDLVGRYFMEHLRTRQLIALDHDRYSIQRIYNSYHNKHGKYLLGMGLSNAIQQKERILNTAFFSNFDTTEESATDTASRIAKSVAAGKIPDHLSSSVLRVLRDLDQVNINLRRKLLRPGSSNLTDDLSIMVLDAEQAPNRNSQIGLASERDALGLRQATVNWRMTELDRKSLLAAIQLIAAELWLCHRVRVFLPDPMDDELDDWVFNFKDVSHHIGTTRMSDSPRQGVVDKHCKMHGIANLYIAGSSVFPTGGHVNPTMTIVALAHRLSDHLKGQAAT